MYQSLVQSSKFKVHHCYVFNSQLWITIIAHTVCTYVYTHSKKEETGMGVEPTPPGATLALKECSSHEVQMTITQSMHCRVHTTMKTFHQVHICTYLVYFTYKQTKLKSTQVLQRRLRMDRSTFIPSSG